MPLRVRIMNSFGFVLAAFCLFLPFVDARIPAGLGEGGWWWTGSDFVRGGELAQEMQLVREGKVEPVDLVRLYGSEYFDAVYYLPAQPTAALTILFLLMGAVAALMRPTRATVTGAACAAIAATACVVLAQIQAVRHVERAWSSTLEANLSYQFVKPAIANGYGFWVTVGLLATLILLNTAFAIGSSAFQDRDDALPAGRAD